MRADLAIQTLFRDEDFAPFGAIIDSPDAAGARRMYSDWLGGDALDPVFHTNAVQPSVLPLTLESLESHPHAAQCFVPLDVSRYLVTVAKSDANGGPALDTLETFLVPGTRGVIYGRGVWHASATVFDRIGHFAVLMWRGRVDDDIFIDIPPHRIVGPLDVTPATEPA
jgi:ureidoglycolate lyase